MNADGGNPTGITTADPVLSILFGKVVHNVAPTWSPDNQQILFLSDRNGKWEFFTVDPNGQNIRQVLKNVTDAVSVKFSFENERMMDWVK
jgi:Tol biopolymer transport system component